MDEVYVNTLRAQRNTALDSCAQLSSQLAARTMELAQANKRIEQLTKQLDEVRNGRPS